MVNSVTSTNSTAAYEAPKAAQPTKNDAVESEKKPESSGVVYEASDKKETSSPSKIYKPDSEAVSKMLKESEEKTAQFVEMLKKMFLQQGKTSLAADFNSIDWTKIAKGQWDTPPTLEQINKAQADVAADGYWGVEKTSDRIVDFAKALTGGDPSKADAMRDAFEKGFKQATKSWGQSLPGISQDTYKAVMKKFDDWKNSSTAETAQAAQTAQEAAKI